ncbi:MAG: 50S ribosomal protein L21 [Flavobacteriales bacterium]|nr:50S ribosomal protein L21 [Flavobacteriales bacterium]
MYAVVDIAGQQFKVEKNTKVFAHRLEGKEGSKVTFDKVLLLEDGGKVSVGAPTLSGATVTAKIIAHLKDEKVIVFKKKRRKGYQKQNGHRQAITELLIEGISAKGAATKAAPKAEAKPAAEKVEKKATAPKAEAKPKAEKKEAAPKAEEKTED